MLGSVFLCTLTSWISLSFSLVLSLSLSWHVFLHLCMFVCLSICFIHFVLLKLPKLSLLCGQSCWLGTWILLAMLSPPENRLPEIKARPAQFLGIFMNRSCTWAQEGLHFPHEKLLSSPEAGSWEPWACNVKHLIYKGGSCIDCFPSFKWHIEGKRYLPPDH